MPSRLLWCCVLSIFLGMSVFGPPSPIFDPDDSVEPRQHAQPVFNSRLHAGATGGFLDRYRPRHQTVGVSDLSNSM